MHTRLFFLITDIVKYVYVTKHGIMRFTHVCARISVHNIHTHVIRSSRYTPKVYAYYSVVFIKKEKRKRKKINIQVLILYLHRRRCAHGGRVEWILSRQTPCVGVNEPRAWVTYYTYTSRCRDNTFIYRSSTAEERSHGYAPGTLPISTRIMHLQRRYH